jgi:hypothetical protein
MKVYHYDPETKEYLGFSSAAEESPLEPGVWLIPAHATVEEPIEVVDDKMLVFNSGWELVDRPVVVEEVFDDNMLEYQRLRHFEYPSIGDQLDALFKAGVFPDDMASKIKAVKDKYPKLDKEV